MFSAIRQNGIIWKGESEYSKGGLLCLLCFDVIYTARVSKLFKIFCFSTSFIFIFFAFKFVKI